MWLSLNYICIDLTLIQSTLWVIWRPNITRHVSAELKESTDHDGCLYYLLTCSISRSDCCVKSVSGPSMLKSRRRQVVEWPIVGSWILWWSRNWKIRESFNFHPSDHAESQVYTARMAGYSEADSKSTRPCLDFSYNGDSDITICFTKQNSVMRQRCEWTAQWVEPGSTLERMTVVRARNSVEYASVLYRTVGMRHTLETMISACGLCRLWAATI